MTDARRAAFVLVCIACLLVVASALPAADPRLEVADDGASAGDWDSIDGTSDEVAESSDDETETETDRDDDQREQRTDDPDRRPIELRGAIEPGNDVIVDSIAPDRGERRTVQVNGANVTTVTNGTAEIVVPHAERMTVSIPKDGHSRTVDVPTDARIHVRDGAAPDRDLTVAAAVGSTPVSAAPVYVEGKRAGTTNRSGMATVPMPETAGPADLRVERGPVEGERTVEVVEPTVEFDSSLLFPGAPAPVQVTADGTAVADATVSTADGDAAATDDDGRALLWLPASDEATVTATVGAETATATADTLYLRLAAFVVLVPGFAIGAILTYVRAVAAVDRRQNRGTRRPHRAGGSSSPFIALADAIASLSAAIDRLLGGLRGGRPSIPVPTLSALRPRGDPGSGSGSGLFAVPSLGSALSSLGTVGSVPSFGSLVGSAGRLRGARSRDRDSSFLDRLRSSDDEPDSSSDPDADDRPALAAAPLGPRDPRTEVRTAWHAFLDRLGIDDRERETATPGEVARRALEAGFPADRVRRLVAIVRAIEYGGCDPSPDRVSRARRAAADLTEYEPDDSSDSDDAAAEGSS